MKQGFQLSLQGSESSRFQPQMPKATLHLYLDKRGNLQTVSINLQNDFLSKNLEAKQLHSPCHQIFAFDLEYKGAWLRPSNVQFITACKDPDLAQAFRTLHQHTQKQYGFAARPAKLILPVGYLEERGKEVLKKYQFIMTSNLHPNFLLAHQEALLNEDSNVEIADLFNRPLSPEVNPFFLEGAIQAAKKQKLDSLSLEYQTMIKGVIEDTFTSPIKDIPRGALDSIIINNIPLAQDPGFSSLYPLSSEKFSERIKEEMFKALLKKPPPHIPQTTWLFIIHNIYQRGLRRLTTKLRGTLFSLGSLDSSYIITDERSQVHIYLDSKNNLQACSVSNSAAKIYNNQTGMVYEDQPTLQVVSFNLSIENIESQSYVRPSNVKFITGCSHPEIHQIFESKMHTKLQALYPPDPRVPLIMPNLTDPFYVAAARQIAAHAACALPASAAAAMPASPGAAPQQPMPPPSPSSAASALPTQFPLLP